MSTTLQAQLLPSDTGSDLRLGTQLALSADGRTALISVDPYPREHPILTTRAFVFVRRNDHAWVEQGILAPPDLTIDSDIGFGSAVALSEDGNTAFVGASLAYGDQGEFGTGAVYVFTRDAGSWSFAEKILPEDGRMWTLFGQSIAWSDAANVLLVGAPHSGYSGGAAYVLTRTAGAWVHSARLERDEVSPQGEFGIVVALSSTGKVALICNRHDSNKANAVYVFSRDGSTWTREAKLHAETGGGKLTPGAYGTSLALSADGNTALIGDFAQNDIGLTEVGAVFVFERDGGVWARKQELLPNDGRDTDHFGTSIALSRSGNVALIGSDRPRYDDEPDDPTRGGKVSVFALEGDTWMQQATIVAPSPDAEHFFGISTAISAKGDTAIIGAALGSAHGVETGATAYVFALGPRDPPALDSTALDGTTGVQESIGCGCRFCESFHSSHLRATTAMLGVFVLIAVSRRRRTVGGRV